MSTSNDQDVNSATSAIWKNLLPDPDAPDGFTVKTTYPGSADGVEVLMEGWRAGTAEPAHSHPGDDMTVVVEGSMSIQFHTRTADGLVADGPEVLLNKGDTGYIKAGRIHSAKYLEECKLVYVHDRAFGFVEEA